MLRLTINEKEYKIRFGYNSFCDTDLMDRTNELLRIIYNSQAQEDSDVNNLGMLKDLFLCVRELMLVGMQKYNPVESLQEVGNLLDDYQDEAPEGEKRGLLSLFTLLSEELMSEGFLAELMSAESNQTANSKIEVVK